MKDKNATVPSKEESGQKAEGSELVLLDRAIPFERVMVLWGAFTNKEIVEILEDRKIIPYSVVKVLQRPAYDYPDEGIKAVLNDEDGYESYKYKFVCEKARYRQLKDSLSGKGNSIVVFNLDDIEMLTSELQLDLSPAYENHNTQQAAQAQHGLPLDILIENFRILQMTLAKHAPEEPMASAEYLTEILTSAGLDKSHAPDNAAITKKINGFDEWERDIEAAVQLAAECAIKGKKLSTVQHKALWEGLRGEPRVKAFRAFRRGLPKHLKEEGPSGD